MKSRQPHIFIHPTDGGKRVEDKLVAIQAELAFEKRRTEALLATIRRLEEQVCKLTEGVKNGN